jgi:hypothetical protein
MLLLAPAVVDAGSTTTTGLFGLSGAAPRGPSLSHERDLLGSGPPTEASNLGHPWVDLIVEDADGIQRVLIPDGDAGTYADGPLRSPGEETEGELNIVDHLIDAWSDDEFREEVEFLAATSGGAGVRLILLPGVEEWEGEVDPEETATDRSRGTSSAELDMSQLPILEFEVLDRASENSVVGAWASNLGLRSPSEEARFRLVWMLAHESARLTCDGRSGEEPPYPIETGGPTTVLQEGWNAYLAARALEGTVQISDPVQGLDTPLGVTQLLLDLDRAQGPDLLELAWSSLEGLECATLFDFVSVLRSESSEALSAAASPLTTGAPLSGAAARSGTKSKAKPRTRAKAKAKTKTKTKAKAKPKAKAKAKTKAKPKAKTKAKPKAKTKAKTKAKPKVLIKLASGTHPRR